MLTEAQLVSEGRATSASQTWFRFRSQDALLQGLGSPYATKKKAALHCSAALRGWHPISGGEALPYCC